MALFVVHIGGCSPGATESRLEHHVAAHKPSSYADAVEQIQLRHSAIYRKYRSSAAELDQDLDEMLDIIRWLPELAGDSALKKRDWDRVRIAATELLAQYELVQVMARQSPRSKWAADEERIAELSASLTAVVASSQSSY